MGATACNSKSPSLLHQNLNPTHLKQTAALRGLAACQRAGGTLLKPHAAKIETAAYAVLASSEGEAPALRAAACACLARIPSTLADPAAWTTMLLALLGDAARTLKHVWPDCPALSVDAICTPPSHHRPALGALPHEPEKKGAGMKSYAIVVRRRLTGALSAAAAFLEEGYHHQQGAGSGGGAGGNSPVVLPTPQLLALCDALLAATPKGASPLGATPSALPPTALHALQPLLRHHGLAHLGAYLPAARTSCTRHLPRVARCILRALSWPASHGFRPRAYRLLALLVRVTPGGAALKGLVEPALPLLTHHAAALVRPAAPASLAAALASSSSVPGGSSSSGGSSKKAAAARKKRAASAAAAAGAAGASSGAGDEMGSTEAEIAPPGVAVLEALEVILLSSGALLSLDGRTQIDRVVACGLAELNRGVPRDGATQPSLAWVRRSAPLRAAFLNLAVRALLVPRPDGTASALTPLAARVFGALVLDADAGVARAALLGRAAAETITHPRAAPVCIPAVLLRLDDDEEDGPGVSQRQRRQQDEQEAEVAEMDLADEPFVPQGEPQPAAATADVWATGGAAAAAAKEGSSKRKAAQPPVAAKAGAAGAGSGSGEAKKKARVEAVAAAQAQEEEEEEEDEPLPDIVDDDGPDDESEEE